MECSQQEAVLSGHERIVCSVFMSADGRFIASGMKIEQLEYGMYLGYSLS